MFDHVKFGVSDYAASKAFFLRALEPPRELPTRGLTTTPGQRFLAPTVR